MSDRDQTSGSTVDVLPGRVASNDYRLGPDGGQGKARAAFPLSRFWSKVSEPDENGCWNWVASSHDGYGRISWHGFVRAAHRISYTSLVGPIPDGLQLDHLCRNRACVNPAHLEPVTNQENSIRGNTGSHNSAKTHCPDGHVYDEANTYRHGDGWRRCKKCISSRRKP